MTFEQKLSLIMDKYNVANTALGDYLFVSRSTVSKWRSGVRTLNKDACISYC
jgi:DNA-binding transcriptional regulator YiaG